MWQNLISRYLQTFFLACYRSLFNKQYLNNLNEKYQIQTKGKWEKYSYFKATKSVTMAIKESVTFLHLEDKSMGPGPVEKKKKLNASVSYWINRN